ncbi:MAG TPA: VCBS repeat-containing protein [Anaerolineae bacterium]|nr:VCBS repeat-containing protein [Anaerolineae bacterium]
MSRLAVAGTPPPATTIGIDKPPVITPTGSINLLPENGYFVDTQVSLPGVQNGVAIWGDCNNDGVSDILLTGQLSTPLKIARVYRQLIGGGFTLDAVFTGVLNSAAAWGDYDNDGWLDIALTGESDSGLISQVYHNVRNSATCTFSAVAANLVGVRYSTVAWGDYNADGQLDLLVAGDNGSQPITKIYRNNHGAFSDSGLTLPGIQNGAAIWGDYDNDGLADLLLTGATTGNAPLTKLYHNNGDGTLVEISTTLPALSDSAAAWGDYDSDGNLDLLLEGTNGSSHAIAAIYHNNHGIFAINNNAILTSSLHWANAAWGDYDTDGYLDALLSTNDMASAYHNENGSFASKIDIGSSALDHAMAAWGHYDNDRNLEVVVTGKSASGLLAKIYKYSSYAANLPPQAPAYLTSTVVGSAAVLRWSPAVTDDHTPLAGLSYNLRIGTQPGGIDIVAPMAFTDTGSRLLPALGNVYQARAIMLSNLPRGKTLYWGVQAIDASFLGSSFAEGGSFEIPYRVFLPVVLNNFISYYSSGEETEPNNTYLQANGPLKSGQIYRGVHDDAKDYWSIYLPVNGTVNVDMISPNGDTQLQLFYQIADVDHRVGYAVQEPYHIGHTGAAGWYYIYVYTNPAFVGTQTYTLTVTYP